MNLFSSINPRLNLFVLFANVMNASQAPSKAKSGNNTVWSLKKDFMPVSNSINKAFTRSTKITKNSKKASFKHLVKQVNKEKEYTSVYVGRSGRGRLFYAS